MRRTHVRTLFLMGLATSYLVLVVQVAVPLLVKIPNENLATILCILVMLAPLVALMALAGKAEMDDVD